MFNANNCAGYSQRQQQQQPQQPANLDQLTASIRANNNNNHLITKTNKGASETILNSILEKTSNIERATNIMTIRVSIKDTLKELSRNEKDVRQKTITFHTNNAATGDAISEAILAWVAMSMSGPPSCRQSKEHFYVQMASISDKEALVDYIKLSNQCLVAKDCEGSPKLAVL